MEEIIEEDYTNEEIFFRVRTLKCTTKMPAELTLFSSVLNFMLDYALPLIIIFVFTCKIEWHSFKNRTMNVIFQRRVQNLRVS